MNFSVIIPSKNADNLLPCIIAIKSMGETARIIVVDDGVDWKRIGIASDGLMITKGVKPFVFARNLNIGIQAAGDDDVIVLNDDALLRTELGFTKLAEQAARGNIGLIAASCDTVGNPNQFRKIQYADCGRCRSEPRMVCFVCVYIPRSTINAVGLLDERYVDYGLDDDDYCLEVRRQYLNIGVFDGCFVDHGSMPSSFRTPSATNQGQCNFLLNMKRFIEKWGHDNWGAGREHSQFANLFPEVKS